MNEQWEPQRDKVTTNFNEPVAGQQPTQNRAEHPLERVAGTATGVNNVVRENDRFPEPEERRPEKGFESTDAEVAHEVSPPLPNRGAEGHAGEQDMRTEDDGLSGQGLGWTGIVLSILAFFIYPVFLGIAGAIFGFLGYRQGAQTLGIWAMVLGGLAVLGALLFSPYFAR